MFYLIDTAYTDQLQQKKIKTADCEVERANEVNMKLRFHHHSIKQTYNRKNKAV